MDLKEVFEGMVKDTLHNQLLGQAGDRFVASVEGRLKADPVETVAELLHGGEEAIFSICIYAAIREIKRLQEELVTLRAELAAARGDKPWENNREVN